MVRFDVDIVILGGGCVGLLFVWCFVIFLVEDSVVVFELCEIYIDDWSWCFWVGLMYVNFYLVVYVWLCWCFLM